MRATVLPAVLTALLVLSACGSSPSPNREQPPWITQPTRVLDNGYVVYVGSGEEVTANDAELAAEGMALQDLANECSFIPKGTRVEDRYSEKQRNTYRSYAKVAVEYQLCSEASKANDPSTVKNLANVAFTEELKKFEESIQENRDQIADSGISEEQLNAPQTDTPVVANNVHYFMARQYVVYQNQAVILSPATAYAPGSPETQAYLTHVRPVIGHLQTYARQNPGVTTGNATWSSMAERIRSERPQAFSKIRPVNQRNAARQIPPKPNTPKRRRGWRRERNREF